MTVATPVPAAGAETPIGTALERPVATPDAWLVLVAGAIGLAASVALTFEKIRLLADPGYVPSCNLNPVLSCGSVMATDHASVLGLPYSLIGIAAFTAVLVSGVLAVSKVPLPRWYWCGLAFGSWAGTGLLHWLIFTSLYRVGALCPYCMAVWAVTIPLVVVVTSIAAAPSRSHRVVGALHRWRWSLTTLWFLTLTVLIFIRFQNYWSTLI